LVQLQHSGRVSHRDILGGATPVAPSAVRLEGMVHTDDGKKPFVEPRALTSDEVRNLAKEFSSAARRARSAGADGVELHAANGHLLAQFLSPGTNHRTDAYGGSAENRARIVVEVARATVCEIGADRVGVRISPGNPENDIHDHDDDTYMTVAGRFRELGLAYLHVRTTAGQETLGRLRQMWPDGLVLNQSLGTEPTTREQAAEVLEAGVADAVTIGRRYLANPDLVRRWTEGAELNQIRSAFLYRGGAEGYTDYPVLPPATPPSAPRPGRRGRGSRYVARARRFSFAARRLACVVDHRGAGRVRLDRLNALLGVGFCPVSLAGGDDLAVRGLQVEPEFAVGHPFLEPW
jgi:N-ethylmaleimide reductase